MAANEAKNAVEHDQAVKILQELGLTGSEADVYYAALTSCADKPISSYRLAREMGRDTANVGKVLGHLVRAGAMSMVQEKPRLFVPTDPAAFADQVQSRVAQQAQAAVALLRRRQNPLPDGLTLALANREQILAKTRELLAGCRDAALVFGSKESLREIGAELEELGEKDGRTVRVLSPVPMISDQVDITVFSLSSDLKQLESREFLQLVVDNRAWLSGLLDEKTTTEPAGWWCGDSQIARVMAASLALAGRREPVQGPAPTPPRPQTAPKPECTTGITFLIRHNGETSSGATSSREKKGELSKPSQRVSGS